MVINRGGSGLKFFKIILFQHRMMELRLKSHCCSR